jgi:FkbM family methyltransferase
MFGKLRPVTLRNLVKRILIQILPSSIYLSINAYVAARDIRSRKRYEPEIALLSRFVKEGDRVVDIGANQGLYAYHLSRLVGEGGEVHCLEPIPQNLKVLARAIGTWGLSNVQVHAVACGDRAGRQTFHVPEIDGVPYYGLAHLGGNEQMTIECSVMRLDDIITGPVQFIKCDVEGAESFVFLGAKRIIQESRPTVLVEVEVEPAWTSRLSYTPQQALADIFLPLGYRAYRAQGEALVETAGFMESGNYFLVPSTRR